MKPEEVMETLRECSEMNEADEVDVVEMADKMVYRAKALKEQLTPEENEFIHYMSAKLPPLIGRAAVEEYFPGIIKAQTLAQADSAGLGPAKPWKVGRKVAYPTEELLLWIVGHLGISRTIKHKRDVKVA